VVGLVAADRDESVRALLNDVGNEVLELAGLVAALGESAVAVFTLCPDAGTAQVLAEPIQAVDRAGAKEQRIPGEVLDGHGNSSF
jgi:hypothetical protein